jgi:hypothetical protein
VSKDQTTVSVVTSGLSSTALLDITAAPAADQYIAHEGKEYTTIKEGLAFKNIKIE